MSVFTLRNKPKGNHRVTRNNRTEAEWAPRELETDAQVAAKWASQALLEGRFELGRALANIAANAARIERDTAFMPDDAYAGEPHDETDLEPAADLPPQTEITAVVPLAASDAQTAVFGPPAPQQLDVPASARCHYMINTIGPDGQQSSGACWRPIYLDMEAPAGTVPWRHVDPAYDQDHFALAPENLRVWPGH